MRVVSRWSPARVCGVCALVLTVVCLVSAAWAGETSLAPYRHGGSVRMYFEGVSYDAAIPTPESVLGFEIGSRPVHYQQAIAYLQALADASPRATLTKFGATHEDRPLYYLTVGTEQNMQRVEDIRRDIEKLGYPPATGVVPGAQQIIDNSPAIAWIGHSIHGDELSGVDASLWTAYQLVARTDPEIMTILENEVVIIDPSENPDGRERYLAQIFSLAGVMPNTDASSLQHDGFWPWGRGNHYLFDLNRDWLPLVHPESQARARAILHWNPQLIVDAHEMGPYSSFLFSPPREPINFNITPVQNRWRDTFAEKQGEQFDKRGWSYYTGDWHEEWFPGYLSSWANFTGAVGILYEQAGVAGSGVKRPDGTILEYAQAVAQQSVSTLSNLTTLADNRKQLLSDFFDFRRDAATGANRDLRGAFIVSPGTDPGREAQFLTAVMHQGIQIKRATQSFSAGVRVPAGDVINRRFTAGAYIIPLQQPLGVMAKALLEFDPHLSPEFLEEERRELEKGNGTRMYEVSAWSLALAFDLDIDFAGSMPGVTTENVEAAPAMPMGTVQTPDAAYGFLLRGDDDRSMNALVMLLQSDLVVRCTEKPMTHGGQKYAAGTMLLRKSENPDNLVEQLRHIAEATGVTFVGSNTGYSAEGPDLGSDLFDLLTPPRTGLFMGSGIDITSAGSMWFLLDHEMRLRLSLLDITQMGRYDLSKYNVLIMPSYWGGPHGLRNTIGQGGIGRLKDWVEAGGTLIATEGAAMFCADSSSGLSQARERGSVLSDLAAYDRDLADREDAMSATVDTNSVWHWKPGKKAEDKPAAHPDLKTLEREDELARTFRPQGVITRVNLDPEHWLCFGAGEWIPTMLATDDALMAKEPVDVPARFAPASELRLAGLIWPEARLRWANTAFATRESRGRGQVILFAGEPFFRAYFHGTKRLLQNAILLGPGMGARQSVPW